jgi:hypothetical protein
MSKIFFKAAVYNRSDLDRIIENISIADAESLIRESTAQGRKVNVAAFVEDGRDLYSVYGEMGPTIYGQPYAVHSRPSMDEEELGEIFETLRSIENQYLANLAYKVGVA